MRFSLHSTRLATFIGVLPLLALASHSQAQFFTPGDLVVTTYGSTSGTLADGQITPINLLEFLPTGGPALLTDTLPMTDGVSGSSNLGIVGEYGSSSEGNIQLSGDGQYLTFAGYSATAANAGIQASTNTANGANFPAGTAYSKSTVALAQSTSTDVPRLAVLVGANGSVNSSTVFNNLYNTNNPRAVYSATGSSVYLSGQGDKNPSNQGVFLAATGTNTKNSGATVTGIYNGNDTRYVTGSNGNLYYSLDKKGSPTGIFKISGLPTGAATGAQITAANNGLTGAAKVSYSPEGFFFANATTLYVADTGVPKAGGTGAGGIQKWTLSGSVWSLQYTLTPANFVSPATAASATSGETGFEAITGEIQAGGRLSLYAVSYTAGDANPNGIYQITDNLNGSSGAGETFTEIESAAGNGGLVFKGISFAPAAVPEPSAWAMTIAGLGLIGFLVRQRQSNPNTMNTRLPILTLTILGGALLIGNASAQTSVITGWNFNNYVGNSTALDVVTSPAPTTGNGTASSLGMNNNYNASLGQPASVDTSDITNSTPLSSDPGAQPNGTNNEWRIRGGTGSTSPGGSSTASNGWSSFASIGAQGAEFQASTTGFNNLRLGFDWSPTTQGEANLEVLYTLNGSTFLNVPAALFTSLPAGVTAMTNITSANTVMGGYIQTLNSTTFNNGIVVNFSGIAGAANNPNFAVEFVNASTGADNISTKGTALNNTSGNWRFDEVTISGAAPEPGSFALAGLGAVGLALLIRRRVKVA